MKRVVCITLLMVLMLQPWISPQYPLSPAVYSSQYSPISKMQIAAARTAHDPIFITHESEFVTLGFPGNGTEEDPYRIENYIINGTSELACIYIEDANVHAVIQNCVLYAYSGNEGISFHGIHNAMVRNNTIWGGSRAISLVSSTTLTISENVCHNNTYGIRLTLSHSINIINNTCDGSGDVGISLDSSISNDLIENIISDKLDKGIRFLNSDRNVILNNTFADCATGFLLEDSDRNEIIGNSMSGGEYGIMLLSTRFNNISTNLFQENRNQVYFVSSNTGNVVSWNTFLSWSETNARDQDVENHFEYNYWWDYTGNDTNGDNLGDTPYPLAGSSNNRDIYPLMTPYYELGVDVTGPSIHSDFTPRSFEVNEIVRIFVEVGDVSGVESVTLSYRVSIGSVTDSGSWINLTMTGNGILYSVIMPELEVGSEVEFIMHALDKIGNWMSTEINGYSVVLDAYAPTFPFEDSWIEYFQYDTTEQISSFRFSVIIADRSSIVYAGVHFELGLGNESSIIGFEELTLANETSGEWEYVLEIEPAVDHFDVMYYFSAHDEWGHSNNSRDRRVVINRIETPLTPPILSVTLLFLSGLGIIIAVVAISEFRDRK